MPAYNSNYLTTLPSSVNSYGVTGASVSSNVAKIETKELLVANAEIIFAGDPPDIVEQITSVIDLAISIDLTTTTPEGNPVPYVPGTVVDSNSGETTQNPVISGVDVTTKNGTQMVEAFLACAAGEYVVGHFMLREWSNGQDANAKHVVYESNNAGTSMVQRPFYAPAISRYQKLSALRASDKTYLSIYLEKAEQAAFPSIYVTKGTIGGDIAYTSYKWERPYLPVCLACDGTKFVVITEDNRVSRSTDGVTWTQPAALTPFFPFLLSTTLASFGFAANTQGASLTWLASVNRWAFTWPGLNKIYFTSDVNAITGWYTTYQSNVSEVGSEVTTWAIHNGFPPVSLGSNIYSTGAKTVTTYGSTSFYGSVIYKSTDNGNNWTPIKVMGNSSLYGSNGEGAVLDKLGVFDGYLVAYTRGFAPRRYKSTDAGITWISEATNIAEMSGSSCLILPSSVVAFIVLGPGVPVFKYSSDGLGFDGTDIGTVDTGTGEVVIPTGPTDPYWANVTAMSHMQYAVGALVYIGATQTDSLAVNDVAGSKVGISGYRDRNVSTLELPFLGGAVVKTYTLNPTGFAYTSYAYITRTATVESGDFTIEHWVATDTSRDAIVITANSPGITPSLIEVRVGRDLGSDSEGPILSRINIMDTYSDVTGPVYHTVSDATIPPALTYFNVCIERYGHKVSVYINGVEVATHTPALIYGLSNMHRAEAKYIAQYRVTTGVARYKGPFTPSLSLYPTQ